MNTEKQFTKDDLISFGKHLLSAEREQKIFDFEFSKPNLSDGEKTEMARQTFRSVTDAAFCNWVDERFKTESLLNNEEDIYDAVASFRERKKGELKSLDELVEGHYEFIVFSRACNGNGYVALRRTFPDYGTAVKVQEDYPGSVIVPVKLPF